MCHGQSRQIDGSEFSDLYTGIKEAVYMTENALAEIGTDLLRKYQETWKTPWVSLCQWYPPNGQVWTQITYRLLWSCFCQGISPLSDLQDDV